MKTLLLTILILSSIMGCTTETITAKWTTPVITERIESKYGDYDRVTQEKYYFEVESGGKYRVVETYWLQWKNFDIGENYYKYDNGRRHTRYGTFDRK